jgi:hypothetical protein
MPDPVSPFVRRLIEIIAVECGPTADCWEERLARRLRAEFELPSEGPLGPDKFESLFLRLRVLEHLVAPARRPARGSAGTRSRNFSESY